MGPAACTMNGEKVHTDLLEKSWMAPHFLDWQLQGRALPPPKCLSLKNFFLLESVAVWLGPSISDGFRDSALEPSLSDSSCPARSKVMLRTCRL